jgi:amidohydrolase
MVEIRRDLHQHPELGLEEHRTSQRIQGLLAGLGIEHRGGLGGTGVLGLIRGSASGSGSGRVVALRADMDALPLDDEKDVPYASTVAGTVHACGHDAHMAILLGAARLLEQRRASLPGAVKLLFQPAEETVGGAKLLIEAGALDDPKVDAIFGLHVDPGLEVGKVGLHFGQRNASSDDLRIVVHGRSAHGGYPWDGADAIVAAAQVVTALQTIVSRRVDAREAAVVTLGTIRGGTQGNIVADRVELVGTIRCLTPSTRASVRELVGQTADCAARAVGAEAQVQIEPSYDPIINDDALLEVVRRSSLQLLGSDGVVVFPRPNMGVEDFGFYLARTPGAYYSLGVRNEARGIVHQVHHGLFDIDEEAMAYGAALQVCNAMEVLAAC